MLKIIFFLQSDEILFSGGAEDQISLANSSKSLMLDIYIEKKKLH